MGSQIFGTVVIQVSEKITNEFKQKAKLNFPNEAFAYLLGTVDSERIIVDRLFYPTDVDLYCHGNSVDVQTCWLTEAKREARRTETVIVGDIHSHPYEYEKTAAGKVQRHSDTSPSETDWDGLVHGQIMAICLVQQLKNGHLRARTKFWGPMPQVKLKQTK